MMISRRTVQMFLWLIVFEERCFEEMSQSNKSNEAAESSSSSSVEGSSLIGQQLEDLDLGSEMSEIDRYAIEYFTKVINERPTEARLYKWRGQRYFKTKNYAKAVRDLVKAVQLDRSNEDCIWLLRHILLMYIGFDHVDVEEIFSALSRRDLTFLGDEFDTAQLHGEAVRCYTAALNRKPSTMLYRKRGHCHMKQRNFEMAIVDLRTVLELSDPHDEEENADTAALREALSSYPNFIHVLPKDTLNVLPFTELLKLANEFEFRKLAEEAIHCYHEAITKNPYSQEGYKQRGEFFLKTGYVNLAIDDFLQVAKIEPDDEENWIKLGRLLHESERFNELIKCTKDLKSTDDVLELGDVFSSQGKWNEAIRCYNEALNKEPNNPAPYKRRGHLYWIIDVPNMAVLDFLEVAKLQPADEENWSSLSEILIENRRINELIEYTFQLAEVNQLSNLGDTFCKVEKYNEALICFTEAIQRKPEDAKFYVRRAVCYFKMELLDEAVFDSEHAVELDPECRDEWDLLSRLLFDHGRYEDLIECTIKVEDENVLAKLGDKFYDYGKVDEAFRCYSEGLSKYPRRAVYYNKIGRYQHWQMQNLEQAIFYLKRAVKIEPGNMAYRVDLIKVLDAAEKYDKDIREAIAGCAEVRDLTNEDKAWVENMNQKVETKRIDELIKYLRGLIIEDITNCKINAVRGESENDVESSNTIEKLELNRNRLLKQLEYVHSKYTPEKIFPDLNQTSPGQAPEYLTDKINFELMENPMITPSGITFERTEIMTHLQYHANDPVSRARLEARQLRPNLALKEAIQYWKKSQSIGSTSETNL